MTRTVLVLLVAVLGWGISGGSAQGSAAVVVAARRVAAELQLPAGWLDEGVSVYLATESDEQQPTIFDHPNLTVAAMSSEELFALQDRALRAQVPATRVKDRAARAQDRAARAQATEDLRALAKGLGITSTASALELMQQVFPEEPITPRAWAAITALLGDA